MKKKELTKLFALRGTASEALTELVSMLTDEHDAMQETFDSRSERWQEGDKGQEFQEKLEAMETLRDSMQTALDELEGAEFPE